MDTFVKEKDIVNLFVAYEKENLDLKLLVIDYKWDETEEKNFYDIYVIANLEKVFDVRIVASGDGEMWDLELPFEHMDTVVENNKKFGLFNLNLRDKKNFPRTFVIKGIGTSDIYDNNEGRNYAVKKGRGGNFIPKKKKIILLNNIELYSLFNK